MIEPIKDVGKHMPRIGSVGRGFGITEPEPVTPSQTEGGMLEIAESREEEIARALGGSAADYRTAKRVITLGEKFPTASMPELVVFDYLRGANYFFQFQRAFDGGRQIRGGLVADFVVMGGARSATVLLVQGEYWHTLYGARERDRASKYQYLGQYVAGYRVDLVVEIWENKILEDVQRVVELGLAGIEIGQ